LVSSLPVAAPQVTPDNATAVADATLVGLDVGGLVSSLPVAAPVLDQAFLQTDWMTPA
jgi:hypothetical protein